MREYLTELTGAEAAEIFRPNFWPNTPDILTEAFQQHGRPVFMARLVLAATLAANYGIYGPAYELCENRPLVPGKEEYLDSEKYQIRHWDLDDPASLRDLVARVNRARREHPALQRNDGLVFFDSDNDRILCYAKRTEDRSDIVIAAVNFDPRHTQSGWVTLDPGVLGVDPARPFEVEDLLTGNRHTWKGATNYVALDPAVLPAHLFHVRQARG
jgi:starch synthase (maltosyl-transferring)